MKSLKINKTIEIEGLLVVARDWQDRVLERMYLMHTGFYFGVMATPGFWN